MVPEYARKAIKAFLQVNDPDDTSLLEQAPPRTAADREGFGAATKGSLSTEANPLLGEENSPDYLAISAPEANAYEFQSGGIVDMLNKLKDKFKDEMVALEEEELNAKHAYEQLSQELHDSIENANAEIARRTKYKLEREEDLAGYQGDLADTTADRDADQKYLDDMTALCKQKSDDFASRQQLRQEEIEAIQKAIEIIGGDKVRGSAMRNADADNVDRLAGDDYKPGDYLSLVQLRSGVASPLQQQVAAFLEAQAAKSHSRLLSMVAAKAAADPFKKVKKMIKDLIVKLMEEATEEAEHKGWCDTELTTNQQSRDTLTANVNDLTAEVDQLTALIAKLTAEIAVLKEYYAKAAEATALLQSKQSPAEDAPDTFVKPYKGMQSEGGGVVGMLEVILSDFARLENDTAAAEKQAQEEYEKFMFDSRMDKATKANDIKHKTEKKTKSESALASAKKELANTQEELDAALAYYEKLKPSCVDSGITYEERVKRREAEIQSLQEALQILTGHSIDSTWD